MLGTQHYLCHVQYNRRDSLHVHQYCVLGALPLLRLNDCFVSGVFLFGFVLNKHHRAKYDGRGVTGRNCHLVMNCQELLFGHELPLQELQFSHELPLQELQFGHELPLQELSFGQELPLQ